MTGLRSSANWTVSACHAGAAYPIHPSALDVVSAIIDIVTKKLRITDHHVYIALVGIYAVGDTSDEVMSQFIPHSQTILIASSYDEDVDTEDTFLSCLKITTLYSAVRWAQFALGHVAVLDSTVLDRKRDEIVYDLLSDLDRIDTDE